jgi:hypothetical protein
VSSAKIGQFTHAAWLSTPVFWQTLRCDAGNRRSIWYITIATLATGIDADSGRIDADSAGIAAGSAARDRWTPGTFADALRRLGASRPLY